jgi:dinuclear metal center YbgI/SA1388 family protein
VPQLNEILGAIDEWYDPRWADSWDAVGLVCGDRSAAVDSVLLAVDAIPATVAEAAEVGAQLLVTHHPLLLTGVHGVSTDTAKGSLIHRMIRGGIAHFVAHTNADTARSGVSDALGAALGLNDLRPLDPDRGEPLDKVVTFVPRADAERVVDALAQAGAGRLGDYDRCAFLADGIGTFRPGAGAHPAIGTVGSIETVAETRIEMVLPSARRVAVVEALRAAHPYEEPAFDLFSHAPLPSGRGTGRVGELAAAIPLRDFVAYAAAALPSTVWGLRASGDPDGLVRRVAVCGGSGGSLAGRARSAGADVYLTADLKHHNVLEAVTEYDTPPIALIDAAHWATEAPWLAVLADRLRARFAAAGLRVAVSGQVTDPWTLHHPSTSSNASKP